MSLNQSGWEGFLDLCLSTPDRASLDNLFDLLFTPEEKEDLATRFLIIKELVAQQKTQREMAKDLNVSIAKITRGSNAMKRAKPKVLKQLQEQFSK